MAIERIRIKIKAGQFDRAAIQKKICAVIKTTMRVALERVSAEIARRAPVGSTGTLRNSRIISVQDKKGEITGQISMVSYAGFVNDGFGGKGKTPPKAPLDQWVKRKGLHQKLQVAPWMKRLIPENIRSKRKTFNNAERVYLASRFIRQKIARKGVKGQQFITKALKASRRDVQALFRNSFKNLAKKK